MATIINAAPKVILNGIDDQSTRTVPRVPEVRPMHFPLFFGFAERGDSVTRPFNSLSEINSIHGRRTMDYRDAFAKHSAPFITQCLARGNSIMFKRVIPADAATGTMVLKAHVIESVFPAYERNNDGTYKEDDNGDYIPIPDVEISGYQVKWEVSEMEEGIAKRTLAVEAPDPTTKVYPILEFNASSPGSFSGNVGLKLSVPTTSSSSPPDLDLIEKHKTLILRFSMVERIDELSSPNILTTLGGETSVDFTLKEDVIDKFDIERYYKLAVIPAYEDQTTPGVPPIFSPIGDMYLYKENHETVAKLILESEIASLKDTGETGVNAKDLDIYEVNYFTGVTPTNIPFSTVRYEPTVEPNKTFTALSENNTIYLSKGNDGDISVENLDVEVLKIMLNGWEDPTDPLSDIATRPFSAIWDTGYVLDTKKGLCEALSKRKDVYVNLSTFEHDTDALNWAEEESVTNVLKTYASGFPESEIYGTPTCRALVISGRGNTVDNVWKEPVPLALDLIDKYALFMGAGNGIMSEGFGFDQSPGNQINLLRDVTGIYKTERQRQKDWDAGMVYAQGYDRVSNFYPAVQTVYPDDTSTLNSAINMAIATELNKVCEYVWKNLSGNAKLTPDQFLERSDTMITERTTNRFDERAVIVPETFYTAADTARGFSWSCRVYMYTANMKTVGAFTIVSRRIEDLAA